MPPEVWAAVIGGIVAVLGLIVTVIVTLVQVKAISRQVHANGGNSMKDVVVSIQRDVSDLKNLDSNHSDRIVRLETKMEVMEDRKHTTHQSRTQTTHKS
jgi:hypothetical protein